MNNEEKQPDEIAITADQMMQILLDGQRELEARVTLLESQQIATEAKQAAIETRQKASDEAMQSYFEKLKKQTAPLLVSDRHKTYFYGHRPTVLWRRCEA